MCQIKGAGSVGIQSRHFLKPFKLFVKDQFFLIFNLLQINIFVKE
jgi:hypothetical protein